MISNDLSQNNFYSNKNIILIESATFCTINNLLIINCIVQHIYKILLGDNTINNNNKRTLTFHYYGLC